MDNLSNDKMNLFLRENYPDDGNRSYVCNLTEDQAESIRDRLKCRWRSANIIQHPTQPHFRIVDCLRGDYKAVREYCDGFVDGWRAHLSNCVAKGLL